MIKSLDKIDKKILEIIDMEARLSISQIAKLVNKSKNSVNYRIKRMEKLGIILGYYPLIDIYKIGNLWLRIWLKLDTMDIVSESNLLKYLKNIPQIAWVGGFEGVWDIGMVLLCSSIHEFNEIYDQIIERFGNIIDETSSSIATELNQFKHRFLYDKFNDKSISIKVTDKLTNLDNTEILLLNALKTNCRINIQKLSKESSVSPATVRSKIKQLEKKRIITAYCTKISYQALGLLHYKVFLGFHRMNLKEMQRINKHIMILKQTIYTQRAIGRYNYEFEVVVKDHSEFYQIIKILRKEHSSILKNYEYYLVRENVKMEYHPML